MLRGVIDVLDDDDGDNHTPRAIVCEVYREIGMQVIVKCTLSLKTRSMSEEEIEGERMRGREPLFWKVGKQIRQA